MDGLQWKIPFKWMIWGYPYFRKPPYAYMLLVYPITRFLSYVEDTCMCVVSKMQHYGLNKFGSVQLCL